MRTSQVVAVCALAVMAVLGACSGDDDGEPTTSASTVQVTALTTPPSEPATSFVEPPATATTTPPTTAPPTTQSPAQLHADVAAAFLALEDKNLALLMNPEAPDLAASVAEIAVPGSPYAQLVTDRVNELVANDQYVRLNDPNLRAITVERIEVLDPPTSSHVNVTVCQVGNAVLVKRAEASPVPGRSIPVAGSGELRASRYTVDLVRTDAGWRHSGTEAPGAQVWTNSTECPPP